MFNIFNKVCLTALSFALFASSVVVNTADARVPVSRIKDLADIEGVRTNILIGYGLVVGLAGTGDSSNSIPFTRQSLVNMLEKVGVNTKAAQSQLKTKNVAAVMITANMASFARQGSKMDITVSSLGDAGSLEGGQLIATPLIAADGLTYAIAQGAVTLGGFSAGGANANESKNHTTSGHIASGAMVERETGHELSGRKTIRLILRNPDFTTAMRMKDAINKKLKLPLAMALDNGTVDVSIPKLLRDDLAPIIQKIENVYVRPDTAARVVIDEKTGTIVMGNGVQISDVAISHSNLTIRVTELRDVIQPDPLTGGVTAIEASTEIETNEEDGRFHMLDTGANLADLVDGLNSLGVRPRDIISILQTIKQAGALQAEIIVM